jgi:hypothetical protein
LPAHLAYVTTFHFAAGGDDELATSVLGYYLANFQQALGFFLRSSKAAASGPAAAAPGPAA